ncbi:sarcosine oxidase subunit gamma family protein [Roseibium porphyridii]|uniref:Sarcosine oxidase subunit gamma family protein n=1 Tax=Roseibium porphyridii TaxID=2866279 RepID=A0ABY8EXN8_9HYPH|nr:MULTISPECIES: sarcosine oxidase subunit gamma family protein [Stappiaceae]QFT32485.1 Sarcosine oxidase, gamma subunit family [Labrenzia sp. THAF82]WFE87821.1 sarcosine oxidase subunit gamma family protein [Roseibium sp. KMA01]
MSDLMASDLITPDAGEAPLLSTNEVSILKVVPLTRLSLRLREASQKAAGSAFGVDLPVEPLSSATAHKRAALWMGPDEWTLLAPESTSQSVFSDFDEQLGAQPHSLVDVSERSEAIIVSGQKAAWLLNTGIFIDFSIEEFPVGTVSRTIFHKSPVMVWRTGEEAFVVEAWVSFMDYVSGLLVQSASELSAA